MAAFLNDLGFALRLIRKTPWFSGLAVVTLALGIGAVSGHIVILWNVEAHGVRSTDGRTVYQGYFTDAGTGKYLRPLQYSEFEYLRDRQAVLDRIGGYFAGTINLSDGHTPRRYQGTFVTRDVMDLLGVEPVYGRAFRPEDFRADTPQALLIAESAFREDFDGDPLVLGQPVRINGRSGAIVGVLPDAFAFPVQERAWLAFKPRDEPVMVNLVGVLAPDASPQSAAKVLTGLAREADADPTATADGDEPAFRLTAFDLRHNAQGFYTINLTLTVVAICVLLIACANVANLLLARSATRVRELGIRVALGASRRRIAGIVLLESLILSLLGLVLGLVHQMWELDLVEARLRDMGLPYWIDFGYGPGAFALSLLLALLAALLAGMLPALRASRIDVMAVLKDDSRTGSGLYLGRLSRWLVVVQIAVSCALLILAGLMVTHLRSLMDQRLPFETEDVLTARFGLFEATYPESDDLNAFADNLLVRLREQPEIAAAALTTRFRAIESGVMPVAPKADGDDARASDPVDAAFDAVTPGFLEVFGIPLRQGRGFTPGDGVDSPPVVVIDSVLAATLFPDQNPVGRFLDITSDAGGRVPAEIVGVCGPAFVGDLSDPATRPPGGFLVPFAQQPKRFATLAARSASGDPDSLLPAFRQTVRSIDPDLPLYFAQTPRESIREAFAGLEVVGVFLLSIGGIALFLASVGLYGLMAFTVSLRRQEIGIRMALGADSPSIFALMIRYGLAQIALGIGCGLVLAVGLAYGARSVSPLLIGPIVDTRIFGAVVVLLGLAALAACLLPARRASRQIHPLQELRYE